MGSVFLWAVVLAFMILGMSIPQLLQSGLLSISAVPPDSYLPPASLPVLLFPCPDLRCWPKLAWYVLGDPTCAGFPQHPDRTLCVMGLVCTCLGFPGAHSAWRGLRASVSAPHAHPLRHRTSAGLFQLPMPTLCITGFRCTCFVSLPSLSVTGVICSFFSCAVRAVCAAQVCMPPLCLAHQSHPLR